MEREGESSGSASGGQQKAKERGRRRGWREQEREREKGSAPAEISENTLQPVETALSAKWSESNNSPRTLSCSFLAFPRPTKENVNNWRGEERWGGGDEGVQIESSFPESAAQ